MGSLILILIPLIETALKITLKPETQELIARAFDKGVDFGTQVVKMILDKKGDPTDQEVAAMKAALTKGRADWDEVMKPIL